MNYRDLPENELDALSQEIETEVRRRHTLDQIRGLGAEYVAADHPYSDLVELFPSDESDQSEENRFAMYAHMPENKTQFWGTGLESRPWATGAFVYYPGPWGHSELRWDEYWADVVARFPDGLDVVVSPKVIDDKKLKDFCERLPQAWRDRMIFAFYQEPEDNFTTEEQIAGFRSNVKRAGQIVRPYGIRNAVELQEWSLNPANKAYPSGMKNTARFVDPADVDHISWSVYEKNLKDRSQEMVGRIKQFMGLFPTLTWDMSATGVAVPVGTPQGDSKRETRARITRNLIDLAMTDPRCTGFGWFDFPEWGGTLDYKTDQPLADVFSAVK